MHEPIGVVAMITPWNWPLNQICAKVAPALAAGNAMILKPSEETPGSAAILAEILHDAGVPAGVFNLVQGDGPTVGAALSSHKGVDMVSFTGSTRAGIAVAEAAAKTVKRVHQELGGKAPNLVLEGADLATVLPPTVQGVLANSGQSCIAPTRLLVHKDQVGDATRFAAGMLRQVPVGDPAEMGAHIGPLVNKAQFDKVQELIQSAIDEGAELVAGGTGRPDGRNAGYFVKPTVLAGVTPEMRIWREETFGPVATITSYDDAEQAVELANDTDYGLSATISGDPAKAAEVASRLRAGLVTINTWSSGGGTPFGGFKQSGNGREGGKYGLGRLHGIEDDRGLRRPDDLATIDVLSATADSGYQEAAAAYIAPYRAAFAARGDEARAAAVDRGAGRRRCDAGVAGLGLSPRRRRAGSGCWRTGRRNGRCSIRPR